MLKLSKLRPQTDHIVITIKDISAVVKTSELNIYQKLRIPCQIFLMQWRFNGYTMANHRRCVVLKICKNSANNNQRPNKSQLQSKKNTNCNNIYLSNPTRRTRSMIVQSNNINNRLTYLQVTNSNTNPFHLNTDIKTSKMKVHHLK
jgi:hypothetical protein